MWGGGRAALPGLVVFATMRTNSTIKWPVRVVISLGTVALVRFAIAGLNGSDPAGLPAVVTFPPVPSVAVTAPSATLSRAAETARASVEAGVVAQQDITRRGGQPSPEECAKEWAALAQGKRDVLNEAAFTTGCDLSQLLKH